MSPWIASLTIILYFSANSVYTYRLFNFGQFKAPQVPVPFLNHQSLANCYLNNNCPPPVMPRDMVLKMLTNAHGRGTHHQSEAILHRLFEIGRNHHREAHTENLSPPGLGYLQKPLHDLPLSWHPQRRTFREHHLYPRMTTATSALPKDSFISNFLPNGGIENKVPFTDKNILRWQTTFNPEIPTTSNFMPVETTSKPSTVDPGNNTPLYDTTVPTVISDADVRSFLNEGSPPSPPLTIVPLSETPLPNINTTALIYNAEIGVKTKSDDKSVKQYVTINVFTDVPKQMVNGTINMFSTNQLNGVIEESHTLSTSHYIITSSTLNPKEIEAKRRKVLLESYSDALDKLERKFYGVSTYCFFHFDFHL